MKPIHLETASKKMEPGILTSAESVLAIAGTVKGLADALLQEEPTIEHFRASNRLLKRLKSIDQPLQDCIRHVLEMQFRAYWGTKLRRRHDRDSYSRKQHIASELNATLRHYGYLLRHPKSGEPCTLLVVASPDGKGRYVLADRLTKKRSCTSGSLLELMPIKLIKEPRRREVFLKQDPRAGNE